MLFSLPALTWPEVLLRLALAAVFGAAIGVERELREREAGLRTHLLVSVGSALFTIVSAYGFREFLVHGGSVVRTDPSRIAAQIVTGIGFLGAGAIIRQGFSVRGLTTAATLWVVAAIGMASGAGYYSAAAITTVLVILSLWPLRVVAHRIFVRFRPETSAIRRRHHFATSSSCPPAMRASSAPTARGSSGPTGVYRPTSRSRRSTSTSRRRHGTPCSRR